MRSASGSESDKKKNVSFEQEVNRLTQGIEQFRIDSLRYFAGDLKVPPDELKTQIATGFRRLRVGGIKGVADNFRLNSLEARFNSQVDLYNRKLREREQSGSRKSAKQKAAPEDPMRGVTLGKNGDSNAVEVLYKGLYLSGGSRNPSMDLEKFRSYIDRQAAVVRSKTGCENIQFRIAVEDGKMKIKAKPVK